MSRQFDRRRGLRGNQRSTTRLTSRRRRRLILEQLEQRQMLSGSPPNGGPTTQPPTTQPPANPRPINEVGNNTAAPNQGTAGTDLIRIAPAGYTDGLSSPSLPNDLSARDISNILNSQADPKNPSQDIATVDQNSLSDFGYVFGQFMDHDMDLTLDGGAEMDIPVSAGDPIGPNPLPFTRSQFDPTSGTTDARQQVNSVTSYLDLSQVYGSDLATANALRTMSGGLMKTSPGNDLPYDNLTYFTAQQLTAMNAAAGGLQNGGGLSTTSLFATGDVRGNENLELTALQTLFVRNHNAIAAQLQKAHPQWTDEQLYQEARKLNIAEYQSIVYNEWIPAVLGPNALPAYKGYNPNVDASIANEFSTVAFRFGHSLLSGDIERQSNNGLPIADANADGSSIPLAEDFFDPNLLNPAGVLDPLTGHTSSGIDAVLKGDADGVSQADDLMAVQDVRNLLFGDFGAGGEDLMARDVQRGRDNGIPSYNALRVAYGLPAVTSFDQISSNPQVVQELEKAYPTVNDIDAFEGGLAEDHVKGSDVGPLFQAIMVDQFTRLRDGDRFFYLNESFTPEEAKIFQQGNKLAKVIEGNTNITNLQSNVFFFKASISGTVSGSAGSGFGNNSFGRGLAGITLQLFDSSGDLLATTVTDNQGHYSFNQLSGPAGNPDVASGVSATGFYKVVMVAPSGMQQAATVPGLIFIGRGDTNVNGLDFQLGTGGGGHRGGPPGGGVFGWDPVFGLFAFDPPFWAFGPQNGRGH